MEDLIFQCSKPLLNTLLKEVPKKNERMKFFFFLMSPLLCSAFLRSCTCLCQRQLFNIILKQNQETLTLEKCRITAFSFLSRNSTLWLAYVSLPFHVLLLITLFLSLQVFVVENVRLSLINTAVLQKRLGRRYPEKHWAWLRLSVPHAQHGCRESAHLQAVLHPHRLAALHCSFPLVWNCFRLGRKAMTA